MDGLFSAFVLAQIIGFVGYGLYAYSSYQKNRFALLSIEAAGCLVVALHWAILDMPTIALMNIVYVYMGVLSLTFVRYPAVKPLLYLSFPIIFYLSFAGWGGQLYSLIAICATMVGVAATTLAVCSKLCADIFRLRLFSLLSAALWVACGIFAGSVPQIIACGIFAYGHLKHLQLLRREKPCANAPSLSQTQAT